MTHLFFQEFRKYIQFFFCSAQSIRYLYHFALVNYWVFNILIVEKMNTGVFTKKFFLWAPGQLVLYQTLRSACLHNEKRRNKSHFWYFSSRCIINASFKFPHTLLTLTWTQPIAGFRLDLWSQLVLNQNLHEISMNFWRQLWTLYFFIFFIFNFCMSL